MNKIHYVYHIPHPNYPNNITQGYIGVTMYPKQRFGSHTKSDYHVGHAIRKYNITYKDMRILEKFDNGKDAYKHENYLRPNIGMGFNEAAGGKGGLNAASVGMLTVKWADQRNDERFSVSMNDPKYLSGEYVHHLKGTVTIKWADERNTDIFQVDCDDPRYLSGELTHANTGNVGNNPYAEKTENEMEKIREKMRKSHIGLHEGEKNHMHGLIPVVDITDNIKKKVTKEEYKNNKDIYFVANTKVYQKLKKEGKIK